MSQRGYSHQQAAVGKSLLIGPCQEIKRNYMDDVFQMDPRCTQRTVGDSYQREVAAAYEVGETQQRTGHLQHSQKTTHPAGAAGQFCLLLL